MTNLRSAIGNVQSGDVSRPALRWHGGKWKLAPWILAHFPSHRVYVEPFGGGASVLLRKVPAPAECYNDLDGGVVNVFRVLRDSEAASELRRRLALTPFAREEFDDAYRACDDPIEAARKTIALSFMGYGTDSATRSCRTGFRASLGSDALPARSWASYAEAIPSFTARLLGVLIERRPALEIIDRYDFQDTLFYCDPPYPIGTRSSMSGRAASHGYRHEMTDADHEAVLARLAALRAMAVVSSYPNDLYDRALPGWTRVDCEALADGARVRREVLWINPAARARTGQGSLFARAAE